MFDPKLKEALAHVQKPGRYTGGEPGSVYKEKDKVDLRFAFCFPDTYEVGMSFLSGNGTTAAAAVYTGKQGPAHRI